MKVLWITNMLFPEAINILHKTKNTLKDSGGWLLASAESLVKTGEVKIVVVSLCSKIDKLTKINGKEITYYALPCKDEHKYNSTYEGIWREIVREEKPDLVHIHGTEYTHGLAFLNANTGIKTVTSIQGVVSAIGQYYLEGLSAREIIKNTTLFDLLYGGTLFNKKKQYIRHGREVETPIIKKSDYVIGRTHFDKAWVSYINPSANYYSCNESLRQEFDDTSWKYENCNKHTIFLSQAGYSVKGLHCLLQALPSILSIYPDTKIRIAGKDISKCETFKSRLSRSTYSKLISNRIKKYDPTSSVIFLGPLEAVEMKKEYLNCNLFLCPSSIENSPNSLGEAQVLGVPCIASYVGGIPDFITGNDMGKMYRFEDIPSLVSIICNVFNESKTFDNTIMIKNARERHDIKTNTDNMINIYKLITNK